MFLLANVFFDRIYLSLHCIYLLLRLLPRLHLDNLLAQYLCAAYNKHTNALECEQQYGT